MLEELKLLLWNLQNLFQIYYSGFPIGGFFCYKCSATVAVYTAIGSIVSLKVKSKWDFYWICKTN